MSKHKKVTVTFLTLILFFGLVLSVTASTASGQFDSKDVKGEVTIDDRGADGITWISVIPTQASTRVNLTYEYVNHRTGATYTISRLGTGTNQATSNLSHPDQELFRSRSASAFHTAIHAGQTWQARTNIRNYK